MNRIKSTLARLGIRNFKPTLRKAAERLATVHTPEGVPLPPNTLAELQRDMARLGFVVSQIREIEQARQKRLEQQPESGPTPWFGCWPKSSVLVSKRLICWSMSCCHGRCVTAEQWRATPADRLPQAIGGEVNGARGPGGRKRARHGSGNPHTFHPTKLIIRIMFGPGMDCAIAKKSANSWFVIQPWVATTKLRTSGRTVGKRPKLIDDSRAR